MFKRTVKSPEEEAKYQAENTRFQETKKICGIDTIMVNVAFVQQYQAAVKANPSATAEELSKQISL